MDNKTKQNIEMLKDIFTVSDELNLKTYLWGGFAVDILRGALTRTHSDVDGFTENLVENLDPLTAKYTALGYTVSYIEEVWMLRIEKGEVHAVFNTVRNINGIAHWHHAGAHGTVFFPYDWLDATPRVFHGASVYTFGLKMAYLIKTNVQLISAEWQPREKDKADTAILESLLLQQDIDKEAIKKYVWSHNPWWYGKGYEAYYFPITLV